MQEFSTTDSRHEFTVDGNNYYLPPVGMEEVVAITSLDGKTLAEQFDGFKAILTARVQPQSQPLLARLRGVPNGPSVIEGMSFRQLRTLFDGWAEMGEGVGLPDSQ